MVYNVKAIANYFLDLGERESHPLTHMEVQKLVYIAHGCSLGLGRGPLVGEKVRAWPYGPVFPDLYFHFAEWGAQKIRGRATNEEGDIVRIGNSKRDGETKKFLKSIWNRWGKFGGIELSNRTHQPGSPWDLTMKSRRFGIGRPPISEATIKDYYEAYFQKHGTDCLTD